MYITINSSKQIYNGENKHRYFRNTHAKTKILSKALEILNG